MCVNGEKSACLLIIYKYIEVILYFISTCVTMMIASATNQFSI